MGEHVCAANVHPERLFPLEDRAVEHIGMDLRPKIRASTPAHHRDRIETAFREPFDGLEEPARVERHTLEHGTDHLVATRLERLIEEPCPKARVLDGLSLIHISEPT